jgi:hypothetical protein
MISNQGISIQLHFTAPLTQRDEQLVEDLTALLKRHGFQVGHACVASGEAQREPAAPSAATDQPLHIRYLYWRTTRHSFDMGGGYGIPDRPCASCGLSDHDPIHSPGTANARPPEGSEHAGGKE